MIRKHFLLSDEQIKAIDKIAKKSGAGVTSSDIVRRAIDEFIAKNYQLTHK